MTAQDVPNASISMPTGNIKQEGPHPGATKEPDYAHMKEENKAKEKADAEVRGGWPKVQLSSTQCSVSLTS